LPKEDGCGDCETGADCGCRAGTMPDFVLEGAEVGKAGAWPSEWAIGLATSIPNADARACDNSLVAGFVESEMGPAVCPFVGSLVAFPSAVFIARLSGKLPGPGRLGHTRGLGAGTSAETEASGTVEFVEFGWAGAIFRSASRSGLSVATDSFPFIAVEIGISDARAGAKLGSVALETACLLFEKEVGAAPFWCDGVNSLSRRLPVWGRTIFSLTGLETLVSAERFAIEGTEVVMLPLEAVGCFALWFDSPESDGLIAEWLGGKALVTADEPRRMAPNPGCRLTFGCGAAEIVFSTSGRVAGSMLSGAE
jgi:hypothetical protein